MGVLFFLLVEWAMEFAMRVLILDASIIPLCRMECFDFFKVSCVVFSD